MVLNRVWLASVSAMVFGSVILAWSGIAAAQQYRPDEFLTLDLSKAVLSPKPLGPEASFTPGPLDVTLGSGNNTTQTTAALATDPKDVATTPVHAESMPAMKAVRTAPPRARVAHEVRPISQKPRALVALHGRNPVEAEAREIHIQKTSVQKPGVQTWPCKSGGICDWKR